MKFILPIAFMLICFTTKAQSLLTVDKIMQDPKWIGTSPSNAYWSADGQYLFFSWNPEKAFSDSIYYMTLKDKTPRKATPAMLRLNPNSTNVVYNKAGNSFIFISNGDVYYYDGKSKTQKRITETVDPESNPTFILNDTRIAYVRNQNVFTFDLTYGTTTQYSNIQRGSATKPPQLNRQEQWLQTDQLNTSKVLVTRKEKREAAEAAKKNNSEKELRTIYTDDKNAASLSISPSGRFISYRLVKAASNPRNTGIPDYVTESGFTTNIPGRTKVGSPESSSELYIFDNLKDTVILVKTAGIPGIKDDPDFLKDYANDTTRKRNANRQVSVNGPWWSPDGKYAIVDVRAADNKDRWIMLLDPATGSLKSLDRQRDEAWIGGPGINSFFSNDPWINNETFWFHSEASGYSHLYSYHIPSSTKTQLTSGKFEVQSANLSKDKKYFYLLTNEVHPGEQHFYRMAVTGGSREKLSSMTGSNLAIISPDEKNLAVLYSYSNKPWELYLQENKPGAKPEQVTKLAQSNEFASYPWRDPEIINFTARDGASVPARLYRPANPHPTKPAVIFVHGAGYLQNVHKWWSSYFREYMFHNLLADAGYTVLDIDYRASSGYGRDWRTGIYRHMGGKDLTDQVDGAKYLVDNLGVDANRIGIYGGSYGGFITLMALFTQPKVFGAGAALRSVTDWAHYNDGYTANILNEPYNDSIAYRKSSPIYYAEGLQAPLLMCHGMVDVNVHFQDIVRLSQRLIELKKENWELAVYPVEDHGFVEPSSWTDEYKRILKLFETNLKKTKN
jgi:dipeptidyl aminopeptidase/acylaminoacyl peptidase